MRPRTWVLAGTAILMGVGVSAAVGVTLVRRTVRQLIEAEDRLHATILTCRVVDDYLKANRFAAWPSSWEDLCSTPRREWGQFEWPRDAHRLEALVNIDFHARLSELAAQNADRFSAIRPNGPSAMTYIDVGVEPLLSDIRERLAAAGSPPDSRGK
jgi:hypothetical protein